MRILITSDVFPPNCGGAGWAAFYLAELLKNKGHIIDVACTFGDADIFEGMQIHRAKSIWGKRWAHQALRRLVKRMLKEHKYDMIIANNQVAVQASVRHGVPVISWVHDYWPICYKGTMFRRSDMSIGETTTWPSCFKCVWSENGWIVRLLSPLIVLLLKYRTWAGRRALSQSNAIAYNSESVQNRLSPYLPQKPSAVWYNLCAPVEDNNIVAKKFSRPTILYVGKFTPEKGATLMPKIAELLPETDLIMVGGSVNELSSPLPRNLYALPYLSQQEVFSYMKGADVFIAPALWEEPFGRIPVEALAMGACVVASARGGMKSDIIKNGVNGVLVDPVTAEEFAKRIKELLTDTTIRTRLKKSAQEDFRTRFNQDVIYGQTMDLIAKVNTQNI